MAKRDIAHVMAALAIAGFLMMILGFWVQGMAVPGFLLFLPTSWFAAKFFREGQEE